MEGSDCHARRLGRVAEADDEVDSAGYESGAGRNKRVSAPD